MEEDIRLAKMGDKTAFARIYENVYKDMYRFAFYTLGHQQDAEDVVADAVADAYAGIGKLREPARFKSWIFRILSVKCKRKRKEYTQKTEELPLDQAALGPEPGAYQEVREAFFRLPYEDRLIISMSVFGGYDSREIGRILHKNENTVRSRRSRGLKKLSEMLEEVSL